MGEEWGPWIEHDGKGCPCVGEYGQFTLGGGYSGPVGLRDDLGRVMVTTNTYEGFATDGAAWHWVESKYPVIRYRIRKPKGLTILTDILREVERDVEKVYGDRELEECRV